MTDTISLATGSVRAVLEEARRNRSPVYVWGASLDICFETRIYQVLKDGDQVALHNRIGYEYIRDFLRGPEYFLHCSLVRFRSSRVDTDGEHILFPCGHESLIDETRTHKRQALGPKDEAVCELINPLDGTTRLRHPILDLSSEGLSIRAPVTSELWSPGREVRGLQVLLRGSTTTHDLATVVYRRRLMTLDGRLFQQVGLKVASHAGKEGR